MAEGYLAVHRRETGCFRFPDLFQRALLVDLQHMQAALFARKPLHCSRYRKLI